MSFLASVVVRDSAAVRSDAAGFRAAWRGALIAVSRGA
jgi:hypothetical protein